MISTYLGLNPRPSASKYKIGADYALVDTFRYIWPVFEGVTVQMQGWTTLNLLKRSTQLVPCI